MKKVFLVFIVCLVFGCLAGCAQGLSDDDFDFYDSEEEISRRLDDTDYQKMFLLEGEQTRRGITDESSVKELKKAYADVWGNPFSMLQLEEKNSSEIGFSDGKKVMKVSYNEQEDEIEYFYVCSRAIYEQEEFQFALICLLWYLVRDDRNVDSWPEEWQKYVKWVENLTDEEIGAVETVSKRVAEMGVLQDKNIVRDLDTFDQFTDQEKQIILSMFEKFQKHVDLGLDG